MTTPCSNMQLVKIANALTTMRHCSAYSIVLRLSDRTAHRAAEASQQLFGLAAQGKCMGPKLRRCAGRGLKGFSSAYFEVRPSTLPRQVKEPLSNKSERLRFKDERFAHIAKRKTNAAAPGKWTAHFHQRNQRHQCATPGKVKIKGPVSVRLIEHLRPSAAMKTNGIAMQGYKLVPLRLVERVENAHLQWFADRFWFHKKVVIRERHSFFRVWISWLENFQNPLARPVLPILTASLTQRATYSICS